jgi:hypothetical protein
MHLLLILGIAFVGAGIAILGCASGSLATVGIGAGFLIADGIISLFVAFITKASTTRLHRMQMTSGLNDWLKPGDPTEPEVRASGMQSVAQTTSLDSRRGRGENLLEQIGGGFRVQSTR